MTKEFFILFGVKATIYLIAAFVATIVVVNIIAIVFCPLRELHERSKTPEDRENEREAKHKKREREKAAKEQMDATMFALTGMRSWSNNWWEVEEKEVINEDIRATKCIWNANVGTIIIFGGIIGLIIGINIIFKLAIIIIPMLLIIFLKVFMFTVAMLTK